ncbi:hypothetical protein Q5762_23575 [Streptomyces sp. P9(2023)]|uniref:hypothetical protein n=1 Tax=Streptomyces sp. P9(2023) TaxID=3064394 RepID=UPI0028F43B55|nr:hypothetical protein [Streptomyces sp. P9(2023)]MDT9691273.1 hypothetical protein [Streptomyces sp. P9(2023)]
MSATLAVSLLLSDYENDIADGAMIVGDIYPADSKGVTRNNILIPCGDTPAPKEYDVPPGRYVVSARLPSGIVLSADAEAREGPSTPVTLNMVDSPYESHSTNGSRHGHPDDIAIARILKHGGETKDLVFNYRARASNWDVRSLEEQFGYHVRAPAPEDEDGFITVEF